MNERIRELAIEAKLIASEYNGFDRTTITKAEQKFAELVVRECADIGERYADGNFEIYNQILEHFGVQQ